MLNILYLEAILLKSPLRTFIPLSYKSNSCIIHQNMPSKLHREAPAAEGVRLVAIPYPSFSDHFSIVSFTLRM